MEGGGKGGNVGRHDAGARFGRGEGDALDGGDLGRCHDAAIATGAGAVGTWSTDWPALLGTPIDHVLATDAWTATGSVVVTSLDDSGSDHRPLVVQLEPAAG